MVKSALLYLLPPLLLPTLKPLGLKRCKRKFKNQRGVKIHQGLTGCGRKTEPHCSVVSHEAEVGYSQEENHSADVNLEGRSTKHNQSIPIKTQTFVRSTPRARRKPMKIFNRRMKNEARQTPSSQEQESHGRSSKELLQEQQSQRHMRWDRRCTTQRKTTEQHSDTEIQSVRTPENAAVETPGGNPRTWEWQTGKIEADPKKHAMNE